MSAPGAYYNEFDRDKAAWLRELIKAGLIAPGEVDERSITDVEPADLVGYSQCHFFAGIGVWSYALRLAGWADDRPVWTGSCPCPGFSVAGKGGGFSDPRHLWPAWERLIRECRPAIVFGEQADAAIGFGWVDLVQTDLEAQEYAVGKAILGACSVGAPHRRQRLYFVAAGVGVADADERITARDREFRCEEAAGLQPRDTVEPSKEQKTSMVLLGAGTGTTITMSSREIAELIGKQHANVKISAERLAAKGVIGTLAMQEFTHNGNTYTEYLFIKRDSLVLVAQNSPEFTAAVVDRWQALESQLAAPALPRTMQEALRLAADSLDRAERAEAASLELAEENASLAPRAAIADRIVAAEGLTTMGDAAKRLGIGRTTLFTILRERGVFTGTLPRQRFIDNGCFVVRENSIPIQGAYRLYPQAFVTGKGLAWLAKKLNEVPKTQLLM